VLDVGQGLSVLVQTANHALLYDAGPAFRSRDAGTSVVLPALRALGVRHLDALLISHDDADHRGGAGAVLRGFPAATLIAGAPGRFDARSFRRCDTGASWTWDGVQFRLVGAGATPRTPKSDNDASCLLLVGSGRLLLPGDIGARREGELVRGGFIAETELVLAPHHGSRRSSGASFVEATRPRFVVMSAGYRNRWGFPASEVVQRWERAGACILSTADTGATIFGFSGAARAQILHRQRIDGARLWTARPVGRPDCRRLEPAR
jgi:competence protein ComEC